MFERFTDGARHLVVQAQHEARQLGHNYIGCEHLLLAATRADGPAGTVLRDQGVTPERVEEQILLMIGRGSPAGTTDPLHGLDREALAAIGIDLDEIKRRIEDSFGPGALERVPPIPRGPLNWTGRLPLAEGSKLTLALALREARALHHTYIGTEHVLLGLLRVAERQPHADFAAVTLRDLGLDPARVRTLVLDELRQLQA